MFKHTQRHDIRNAGWFWCGVQRNIQYINLVMFTSSSGRCTVNEPYLSLKLSITLTYHVLCCFFWGPTSKSKASTNHQGFRRSVPTERISEFLSSLGSIVVSACDTSMGVSLSFQYHVMSDFWEDGMITQWKHGASKMSLMLFNALLVKNLNFFYTRTSTKRVGNNFPFCWTW